MGLEADMAKMEEQKQRIARRDTFFGPKFLLQKFLSTRTPRWVPRSQLTLKGRTTITNPEFLTLHDQEQVPADTEGVLVCNVIYDRPDSRHVAGPVDVPTNNMINYIPRHGSKGREKTPKVGVISSTQ